MKTSVDEVVRSSPRILSGTPVFAGTRVPVQNLIDYLTEGDSLDVFLDDFPSVSPGQAKAFLEMSKDAFLIGLVDADSA